MSKNIRGALAVVRDIGYVSFGKYGQYLTALVTLPLSARLLGPSGMGLLAVAMSTYFLGSLITDLGIVPYLAARVDEPGLSQLRGDFIGLRLSVVAILWCGCAAAWATGAPLVLQMAALGLFGGAISSSGDDWVLLGKNKFGLTMLLQSAGRVLYLVALLALLPRFPTPATAMLCLIASTLIPVIGSWAATIRRYGPPGRPRSVAELVSTGRPVLTARLLENTYEQGSATVFASAFSAHSMGLFSASDRPVQAVGALLDAIGWSLIPRMARRKTSDDFFAASMRGARAVALIGVAAAAAVSLSAPWTAPFLFGHAFADSVPLLRLEAWSLPGMAVASFFSTAVLPTRSDAIGVLYGSLIGAGVALATLLAALRDHSPTTVVVGIVGAETVVALFYLFRARRVCRSPSPLPAGMGTTR
ncbi:MAG: lipopolysaccharide biosynthesis protein [Segniliparus sp.]|uniref:lipopolysaccharide biosynthesis protein n=1 Tax=Segniliparus sp. TaxID=2804064 RepID=UPI003F3BF3B6